MIPTHSEIHERILERATCGDIERDDPSLVSLLEECAECRDRMDSLAAVEGLLEKAASEQREVLAGLDLEREAPGTDLVAPFVRARVEEQRRTVPWLRMAAAAALVATSGGVWWIASQTGSEAPRRETFLGSSPIQFTGADDGAVPFGTIHWQTAGAMPPGGAYEIRILDARGTPLPDLDVVRLEQPEWTPSPEEEENLPDEFRLSVAVVDSFGEPAASGWVLVRR
jgi:hypothetical protein